MGNRCTNPRPPPYKNAAEHLRGWYVNNLEKNVAYRVHAASYDDLLAAIALYEDKSKDWQLYYDVGSETKMVVGDSDAYNEIPASVIQLYITETPSSVRRRAAQELEWSVVQAAGDNARTNFMAKYVGNSVSRESHAIFARLLEDYSAKYLPKEKCFPAHQ